MVVGFTTTYAISAHHHQRSEFESRSCQGVLDTTLYDKVCQCGRVFLQVLWYPPQIKLTATI